MSWCFGHNFSSGFIGRGQRGTDFVEGRVTYTGLGVWIVNIQNICLR